MELKSTFLDTGVLEDIKCKTETMQPYEKEVYVRNIISCIEQDIGTYNNRIDDYENIEEFEDTENEIQRYRASMGRLFELREGVYALIEKNMPPLDLSLFKAPF